MEGARIDAWLGNGSGQNGKISWQYRALSPDETVRCNLVHLCDNRPVSLFIARKTRFFFPRCRVKYTACRDMSRTAKTFLKTDYFTNSKDRLEMKGSGVIRSRVTATMVRLGCTRSISRRWQNSNSQAGCVLR